MKFYRVVEGAQGPAIHILVMIQLSSGFMVLESGSESYTHSLFSSPGGSTVLCGDLCCPSTDFLVL